MAAVRAKKAGFDEYEPEIDVAGLRVSTDVDKSPDLYIPTMAYLTYILLYGIARGMLAGDFHPNMLYDAGAFAFLIVVLEVAVMKACFYLFSSSSASTPFWDHVAIATYKFVHLSLAVLIRIGFGSKHAIYWTVLVYCSLAAALTCYFSLQSTSSSRNVLSGGLDLSKKMNYFVIGVAAMQVPICWLLQPGGG